MFPASFVFNTPIDALPVDAHSGDYITTISPTRKLHLDLGTQIDQTAADFYGIPFNVAAENHITWTNVAYDAGGAQDESDCAGASHQVLSPCPASPGMLPIPDMPIVEGGVNTTPGDHHMLVLDTDACRLWEDYATTMSGSQWTVYSSATWDLRSPALRTKGWTSADAAGFPILPLLLRADEASTGSIAHALRFTIASSKIRTSFVWPARHLTNNGTGSTSLPPMGQLFRLKASYAIPASFNTQSHAILQAMKTYGMYVADGGSDWYVTGAPSADWMDSTFTEVQSVAGSEFEAVDITAITSRPGFDESSGAVP